MRTKDWECIDCGKFVSYRNNDSGIPYGCADPGAPEPYDPEFYWGKCKLKEYKKCLKDGINMYNYWQKPKFQLKAMEKLGIIEKDFKLVFK